MSEQIERTNFLAELLGKVKADKTRKGLEAAAARLDEAGVQRKSLNAETLTALVVKAIGEADEDAKLTDVVSAVLNEALEDESTREPVAESPEGEGEEDENEEPEGATDGDPMKTILKAITDQGDTVREDVGQIAKAQLAQHDQLGSVAKLLVAFDERLKAVEEKAAGAPRRASQAAETQIDPGGDETIADLLGKIEKDIKKGTNGEQRLAGYAVTEMPK
jgi:hypothetical protein